jgi:hypothetical protein
MDALRSTLDLAAIDAERKRRGPAVIKLDRNGREIYEPDGAVLAFGDRSFIFGLDPPDEDSNIVHLATVRSLAAIRKARQCNLVRDYDDAG